MAELFTVIWRTRNGYSSSATTGDQDLISPARTQSVFPWSDSNDALIKSMVIVVGAERMIKYKSTQTPAEIAALANA